MRAGSLARGLLLTVALVPALPLRAAAEPPAIDALVEAFADEDPYVAGAAALALERVGPAAVPALTRALADPRESVRWSAAIALGRIGPAAAPAAPTLAAALGDGNATIRYCAASALAAIGPPAAATVANLAERLVDPDADVRRAVRGALRAIDPEWRARPPSLAQTVAALEALLPRLMAEHHVPGVSVALVERGAVAWSRTWGVADAGTRAPVTPETLFEAASMSKPVFAILAMRLVDAGRLELDRPLSDYGVELFAPGAPAGDRITARMALAHTTGLPNWRPGEEEREGPLPLLFEPGSRFGYSGEGVFFLQRAVETIASEPLDRLARRELFAPLGLARSSFAWSPEVARTQAAGHGEDGAFRARSRYTHPNAAYTLYTTAEEYARILAEAMAAAEGRSSLLSRASAREMLRGQVALDAREPIERPGAAEGRSVEWGLGWSINRTGAGDFHHHSGSNRTGFRCFSQFAPARGTALVLFTNGSGGGELWTRLIAAIGDW